MQPLIAVTILSWNGERWIEKCLDSIIKSDYQNYKVSVIDNGSTDKTRDIIKCFSRQVEVIENKKNYGFAEGNNIGVRNAFKYNPDYFVLLNQDVIVDESWLKELVTIAEEYSEFGILTPFQYVYEGNGADPHFLGRMLKYSSEFKRDYFNDNKLKPFYEHSCSFGSAIFVRKEVFNRIGLFDPYYFAYHEEGDFYRRCSYHGFKIALVTSSRIRHWHTSIHPKAMTAKKKYLSYRNTFISILKNPNQIFAKNLFEWLIKAIEMLLCNAKTINGFLKIPFLFYINIMIFIHIPFLYIKRYRERKGPCYL